MTRRGWLSQPKKWSYVYQYTPARFFREGHAENGFGEPLMWAREPTPYRSATWRKVVDEKELFWFRLVKLHSMAKRLGCVPAWHRELARQARAL